jgi:predicted RNase H-like nuclease (RuvC/YqgF family)
MTIKEHLEIIEQKIDDLPLTIKRLNKTIKEKQLHIDLLKQKLREIPAVTYVDRWHEPDTPRQVVVTHTWQEASANALQLYSMMLKKKMVAEYRVCELEELLDKRCPDWRKEDK